jgi:DNA-binding transcriptional MerR regulator
MYKLHMYECCTLFAMYPVKAAAELSGLTPETLRAWERRHGAVTPHRDAKGRRLYDSAMVERLTRLHRLTGRGHPIRDLAGLDDDALDQLLEGGRQAGYGGVETLPGRMLDAIADYQVDVFDRDLSVAIATLPLWVLIERVVAPLLHEVGVRWADGRLAVAQERLVSSLLRARLLSILNQHPRERRPRLLFATLPGERHELGLLGAALHAYEAGVPVLYLGTELPALELARVVDRLDAAAVALSSVDPGQAKAALEQLGTLHAALPPDVAICVGGANARYLAEALGIARVHAVSDASQLARHVRGRASARPLRRER